MWLLWTALAMAEDLCLPGQVITPDTAGHCCWEGQAWTGSTCAGLPLACPGGMRVHTLTQSCVAAACPSGQGLVDGLHCCWPAQSWDSGAERCEGVPVCPPGFGALGDSSCVAGGSLASAPSTPAAQPRPALDAARTGGCPAGTQLAADKAHCCPAGEGWSSARGRCVAPTVYEDAVPETLGTKGNVTNASPGSPAVATTDYDPALVAAVIKRHMSQIRYCYDRELTKDPSLEGRVVIAFRIETDGSVRTSTVVESTMPSEAVTSCVASRIPRMMFPSPKGGVPVDVRYPFTFSSS